MALITCVRCNKQAEGLPGAPLVGARGQAVLTQVCAACWQEWIEQSKLLINHYNIQVADPAQRRQLYTVMAEFLNLKSLA